jgi:outer membrane lipoprotein-sorting protein
MSRDLQTRPLAITTLLVLLLLPVVGQADDGAAILARLDAAEQYDSSYAEMKQVITTTSGQERTLVMRSWSIDTGDKQLAEYLSPADIAGQKMLMTGGGDNIWSFNPETRRTRQIGSHMRNRKVMGSDFTYEDQTGGKASEKFTATVLRQEELGGVACHVLELTPTAQGPSYGKLTAWVGVDDDVIRRIDYHRKVEDPAFKRLEMADIRTVDGKQVPFVMTMTNLEDKTSTVSEITMIRFGVEIPASVFESRNLEG